MRETADKAFRKLLLEESRSEDADQSLVTTRYVIWEMQTQKD